MQAEESSIRSVGQLGSGGYSFGIGIAFLYCGLQSTQDQAMHAYRWRAGRDKSG